MLKTETDGIFCRCLLEGRIHCCQVIGGTVPILDHVPWDGGRKTGHHALLETVRLLHPGVPSIILGLGGACPEAHKNKPAPKSVRWFLKPPMEFS